MCQRHTKIIVGLSVSTLLFRFPVIDYNRKILLNLIKLGCETKTKLQLLTYSFNVDYKVQSY